MAFLSVQRAAVVVGSVEVSVVSARYWFRPTWDARAGVHLVGRFLVPSP